MSDQESGETQAGDARKTLWRTGLGWFLVIGAAAILLVIIFLVAPVLAQMAGDAEGHPGVLLLTLAILMVILVIFAALIAFAFAARTIDASPDDNPRGALSLPHGSISAVLALMILVVFAVSAIHVFNELRAGETSGVVSTGLTQEALAALPDDRVLAIEAEPASPGQSATYSVTLSNPHEGSTEFVAQWMTIFSTLLIAVVGFYFGQGATAKGFRGGARIKGEQVSQGELQAPKTAPNPGTSNS
ncbi:hypothetical protein ITX31_00960 [Arthrobacter gandavensis]|uniref:hypothetical protein n=1 Tax=Arthrobacter gandavensis TaxID=169960 RepID=UPI0018907C77|nr:hypothetical protein [Arthrobacter gandavensis]MBF4992681.1 hypothetical protein [Arthrobacter gandavensis]